MIRIACLSVPLFPLAARLRSEPDLRGEAVAIFAGNGHSARIVAAARRARKTGIRRGMTLTQARALTPKLVVRARDGECERAAQENLLEIAESFSPRFEDAGEGIVYLDLTGLERHFRRRDGRATAGEEPELLLGRALVAATERAGLPARAGIASSKLAARVAAEGPTPPTLVAAGEEAEFLAPLPLARLAPEALVTDTLRRWGIRSIGEFAELPENQVAGRLGTEGRRLHRRARGIDRRPIIPHRPPPSFHEGMDLDWPLVAVEPFLFVARPALDRLCRRLEGRGLACARLELSLRLEPHGHDERSITLPAPTREAKTLLTLVRLDLERRPPGAPVIGFTFTAQPDRPREAQLSLFGPAALSPDRLATTLARLFALLGADGVGSPRTVDGHRPERATLVDFVPPPPPAELLEPHPARGLLAVRVLRPALRVEVIAANSTAAGGGGRPLEVRAVVGDDCNGGNGGNGDGKRKHLRIEGRVRVASGPWSVDEGWWSEEAAERDYWDLELANGGIYRVYRDRGSEEWFADGVYD